MVWFLLLLLFAQIDPTFKSGLIALSENKLAVARCRQGGSVRLSAPDPGQAAMQPAVIK